MKTNIKNLEKANKITLRFSLNYFIQTCVDNGLDNITYCNYLYQANGHSVIISILPKFSSEENIMAQLLLVLDSCLKNLKMDDIAYNFAKSDLVALLIKLI